MENKEIKINLGSGNDYREGYINVDNGLMFPNAKIDITIDIQYFKQDTESVSVIIANHLAMYFREFEMFTLIKDWKRWLKKGGRLEIETIDLNGVISYLGTDEEYLKFLIPLFGTSETGPHKWGWTPESLTKCAKEAGFENIKIERGIRKPIRDFRLIAIK